MTKLVKLGGIVFLLLVVVLIIAIIFVSGKIGGAVKAAVEAEAPKATGAPVLVDSVDISIFSGKGKVKGLVIKNTEGFKTDSAIAFNDTQIHLQIGSLFEDVMVIEEIKIVGAQITYEMGLGKSNIKSIKKNVDDYLKDLPPSDTKYIIKNFIVKDAKVNFSMSVMQGKSIPVPLPDIHLTGIGEKSNGQTAREAINQIVEPIFEKIGNLKDNSGDVLDKLKLDSKGLGEKVKDLGTKAKDKIKGLFGK